MSGALTFPAYSLAERRVDAVIHAVGVPLGLVGAALLLHRAVAAGPRLVVVVLAIYVFGLVGMLSASAGYQLVWAGLLKERLRRLDKAMIFVMIAGTYTPIAATVLYASGGIWLGVSIWVLAGFGIYVTLRHPRRFERMLLGLYLAMGWMLLAVVHACYLTLPGGIFWLIVAGGLVYTVGAVVQAVDGLRFGNPVWHALVLIAAGLHYGAISVQLTGGIG